jgi:hypothetical protein
MLDPDSHHPLFLEFKRNRGRPIKNNAWRPKNHGVWILKCGNATFRVSRAPDMAAKVEPLP